VGRHPPCKKQRRTSAAVAKSTRYTAPGPKPKAGPDRLARSCRSKARGFASTLRGAHANPRPQAGPTPRAARAHRTRPTLAVSSRSARTRRPPAAAAHTNNIGPSRLGRHGASPIPLASATIRDGARSKCIRSGCCMGRALPRCQRLWWGGLRRHKRWWRRKRRQHTGVGRPAPVRGVAVGAGQPRIRPRG
jgi:hypothetical protein